MMRPPPVPGPDAPSAVATPRRDNGTAYGKVFGLVTPMGNPCAEPEMSILTGSAMLSARATSKAQDSRTRLLDYIDGLGPALASFDQTPLAAAGFACTCYYLRGSEAEAADMARLEKTQRCRVFTSTLAIRALCRNLGVTKLALIAPYPGWLADEAKRYFAAAGLDIVTHAGLSRDLADTRGIYALAPADVASIASTLDAGGARGAEAILIGGTGMPSLPFIASRDGGLPVLSSNLALAASLLGADLDDSGQAALARDMMSPDAAWRKRLALWSRP